MQRILILIFIFLLGLNMKQPTNNLESEIIISKKSYKYGFENNTIFLYDEKEDKHYSDNIKIPDDKTILCMTTGDLDDDGTDEILLLSSAKGKKYGNDLIIYSMVIENETIKCGEIYKNDFTNVKPWEIKLCDLDGDNNKDIYVGVYKSTPMFDKVENRPFFFNWNGKILTKKWTGSKLEHPLKSVHFYDIIGDSKEEMIVVEKLENTKEVISIYYWFNFGFIKFAESNSYYNIEDISLTTQDDIKYISLNLGRKKHIKLHLEGNKFIENISLD
ncbi:hypothetical protein [Vallitalea maricola]|uniref:Uncharacterized protein n=1 Tax=Vallitalea maricola TaxID=3074433 RepID=A0ACB5UQ37_9FIRM|nr:hypothetical protein AN2V17_39850 [Vallitalea sp. AN17-2]